MRCWNLHVILSSPRFTSCEFINTLSSHLAIGVNEIIHFKSLDGVLGKSP